MRISSLTSVLRAGLVVVAGACESPTPCKDLTSYDECERRTDCSAVRFVVDRDHEGPIWECEAKR